MNAQEAESAYRILKRDREEGKISEEVFISRVNELRYQDYNGDWWQIRAEDGAWMQWNGSAWVAPLKERSAGDTVPAAKKEEQVENTPPRSMLDKKRTPLAIISCILGVVAFLFHPYIIGILAIITGLWASRKDRLGRIGAFLGILAIIVNIIVQSIR
jgi:hypothetical protein